MYERKLLKLNELMAIFKFIDSNAKFWIEKNLLSKIQEMLASLGCFIQPLYSMLYKENMPTTNKLVTLAPLYPSTYMVAVRFPREGSNYWL